MEAVSRNSKANTPYVLLRLYDSLPERLYTGNTKRLQRILPKIYAIKMRYIQINHPLCIRYIVFDLDYEESAFAWDKASLPPFTFCVINRNNAHCHAPYEIEPVFGHRASKKTLRLLKSVITAYKELLCADRVIVFLIKESTIMNSPPHIHSQPLRRRNVSYE